MLVVCSQHVGAFSLPGIGRDLSYDDISCHWGGMHADTVCSSMYMIAGGTGREMGARGFRVRPVSRAEAILQREDIQHKYIHTVSCM